MSDRLIAAIRKNAREEYRISLSEFKGHRLANMRVFYEKDGEMRPGASGLAIKVDSLDELISALGEVRAAAVAAGRLAPDQLSGA